MLFSFCVILLTVIIRCKILEWCSNMISKLLDNIVPIALSTLIASFFIGIFTYYGFIERFASASVEKQDNLNSKIITVETSLKAEIKETKEQVTQQTKRNNIQDVTIARNSEKLSNVQLTLDRIEGNLCMITDDLKHFMKDTPKEMRSMRKEISNLGASVAVLRDREERKNIK